MVDQDPRKIGGPFTQEFFQDIIKSGNDVGFLIDLFIRVENLSDEMIQKNIYLRQQLNISFPPMIYTKTYKLPPCDLIQVVTDYGINIRFLIQSIFRSKKQINKLFAENNILQKESTFSRRNPNRICGKYKTRHQ